MELNAVLENIDASRDDITKVMTEMIGIPAMSPEIGGNGESKRADMLQRCLVGYDSVQRIDVPDEHDPSIKRSNILAKKEGKGKGTVWIVAHMDTVPAGDLNEWKTDPFKGVVRDGKIYGRGAEDNGQAVISSMFASKFIPSDILSKRSIGIAYVADEEVSSRMGIGYLLEHGYFSPDDVFLVPDWGSPEGSMIDIAEKSLIWLKFEVIGKTTHGSTPNKGQNAFRVGTYFLSELMSKFAREFNDTDDLFDPAISTFEPTKCEVTSENVNTIPGKFVFYMDIRVIPKYSPDDILAAANEMAKVYERRTGIRIVVTDVLRHTSGKVSSTETEVYKALCDSVESVIGKRPTATGVGGATCANFFRAKGYDAYVWEYGGGTLHAPNEYVVIDSIIKDAKVFATLFYKLCV
jgi:succinyl-diaminopimelate desuccinylase